MPMDMTTLYRSGARFGPRAIRDASGQLRPHHWDPAQIERLRELANDGTRPITMYINSAGGNVTDGLAIHDVVRHIISRGVEVTIIVQGMAYSMGSIVLQAASEGRRLSYPHSWIMIHEPAKWAGWQSTSAAAQHLERLKQMQDQIYRILSSRSGKPLRQIIESVNDTLKGQLDLERHGAAAVEEWRDEGILPEALVNFLALLGWSPGEDREILSLEEMEREFSFDRVGASPSVFDPEKLLWMNAQYMARLPAEDLLDRAKPYAPAGLPEKDAALAAVELALVLAGLRRAHPFHERQARETRRAPDRRQHHARLAADRRGLAAAAAPAEPGRWSIAVRSGAGDRRRRGRMRQQAVHAVLGDGELRVVVIVGVNRHAVRKCRETRRQTRSAADDGAAGLRRESERIEVAADDSPGFRYGARQRKAETVEDRALAEMRKFDSTKNSDGGMP